LNPKAVATIKDEKVMAQAVLDSTGLDPEKYRLGHTKVHTDISYLDIPKERVFQCFLFYGTMTGMVLQLECVDFQFHGMPLEEI
jgi:hypothetical protein